MQTIPIVDGTIVNTSQPSTRGGLIDIKRWAAIAWRDKGKPGGLGRAWLKTTEAGLNVVITTAKEGDVIEMAVKTRHYRHGSITHAHYFQIAQIGAEHLLGTYIDKKEVPPMGIGLVVTQPSQFPLIDASPTTVTPPLDSDLAETLRTLETQRAAAKTICNRLLRWMKDGKIENERLHEELSLLSHTLRGGMQSAALAPQSNAPTKPGGLGGISAGTIHLPPSG